MIPVISTYLGCIDFIQIDLLLFEIHEVVIKNLTTIINKNYFGKDKR